MLPKLNNHKPSAVVQKFNGGKFNEYTYILIMTLQTLILKENFDR